MRNWALEDFRYHRNAGIAAINWLRSAATEEFKKSRHFDPPANISDLARMASPIVSMGNQTGEGWFPDR